MINQLKIIEKSTGFTLVELVVTLSVAAILLAVAAPNFRQLIQDNRLVAGVNELSGSINVARSEAVKRGTRVVVCKSANGSDCVTTGNWEQGWIIFVDNNNNATRDTGEAPLRIHEAVEGNVTMTGNGNVADYISYVPEGRAQTTAGASQAGTISACLSGKQRVMQLTFVGRLKITRGTC